MASEALAAQYGLGVSPATIRNTMADLERLGYITQPHTSAGRVPSDKGYRYFVEHLMGSAALPPDEQRTIQHQFHQVQMNVDEWIAPGGGGAGPAGAQRRGGHAARRARRPGSSISSY